MNMTDPADQSPPVTRVNPRTEFAAGVEQLRAAGQQTGDGLQALRDGVADLSRGAGAGDPSSGVVELPGDVIEATAKAIMADRGNSAWRWDDLLEGTKLVFRHQAEVALRAAYPLIAARVRAEAVAELETRIAELTAELEQYRSDARDYDDGWEVGHEAGVAEAVADERQRIAAEIEAAMPPSARYMPRDTYNGMCDAYRHAVSIVRAAGSVPVATPELDSVAGLARRCGECTEDGLGNCQQGCRERSGPVATPTEPATPRAGDWMQTFTGRRFWPLDPAVEDVCIEDIAHALAHQCRYAGHVDRFYSVAEHCVWLSLCVPPDLALAALLHDAAEAYVVDVPRPLKRSLAGYAEIEDHVLTTIMRALGLHTGSSRYEIPPLVKAADSRILLDERAALMSATAHPWAVDGLEPLSVPIAGWIPDVAEQCYLDRFAGLTKAASPVPAEQPPTFEQLLTDPLEQFDTRSELLPAIVRYLADQPRDDVANALLRSIEEYRNAPPATASTSHMVRPAEQPEER